MFKLFSVDDHIVEPAGRLGGPGAARPTRSACRTSSSRTAARPGSGRAACEMTMGLNAVAGKPRELWGAEPARFEDMIPGCYDPHERKKDFLSNGIFASVAFPTLPGFAGRKFGTFEDKDLALTLRAGLERLHARRVVPDGAGDVRADDDRSGVGRGARRRRRPSAASRRARRRCAGWRTRPTSGYPGYHTDYWDPLFDGVPGRRHPGLHAHRRRAAGRSPWRARSRWSRSPPRSRTPRRSAVNMMVSPIPRKFPDIKLVWSEGGIGWITAAIERADRQWERHQYWTHVPDADVLPSEVAQAQHVVLHDRGADRA